MKKVILLNSGGLDSALKAKELFTAMEPVEPTEEGGPTEQRAYEIYSLFIEVKGQLGLDKIRVAVEETAVNYCDHHKVIYLDFGYTPNEYKDANTHVMYDDAKGVPPTRTNLMTGEIEEVPLWSGPPNLSSVMLSIAMSYGAAIKADAIYSGLLADQAKDAAVGYKSAFHAIHAAWQKYGKWPEIIVDEVYTDKYAKMEDLSDEPEEFVYVTKSVPIDEANEPSLGG